MSIAQIVLSDLHLGARDSLLTHFHGGGEIADGPGEVLLSFAHSLRETLTDGEKPQLVLLEALPAVKAEDPQQDETGALRPRPATPPRRQCAEWDFSRMTTGPRLGR